MASPHILIVGGAYSGLSALNTLISASQGLSKDGPETIRPSQDASPEKAKKKPIAPLRALHKKLRYTIIDERDGFYHTVGGPLGQFNTSYADEFWIPYSEIIREKGKGEEVQFLQGKAYSLDPISKKLSYTSPVGEKNSVSYDFLVVATGIRRGYPVAPTALQESSHLEAVEGFIGPLQNASTIVLVGGGAVGIEMAAEAKHAFPKAKVILIHSRSELLSNEPLPSAYKAKALEVLLEQGVKVKCNTRVLSEEKSTAPTGNEHSIKLALSGGETIWCDRVIYTAQQVGANTNFLSHLQASGSMTLLDNQGCIKVRPTLQFPTYGFPNADYHYAVGDVASWPHIKRCGPALRMGSFAAINIINTLIALEDGKPINEGQLLSVTMGANASMALAVGDQAVAIKGGELMWGKEVKAKAFGRGLAIGKALEALKIRSKKEIRGNGGEESNL